MISRNPLDNWCPVDNFQCRLTWHGLIFFIPFFFLSRVLPHGETPYYTFPVTTVGVIQIKKLNLLSVVGHLWLSGDISLMFHNKI